MKYDKYGDPIIEANESLNGKQKKAMIIMIIIQAILVVANMVAMAISGGVYVVFLTASLYIFFFIAYQKGCTGIKETGKLPTYCKVISIVSPIVYGLTAILAIFGGIK